MNAATQGPPGAAPLLRIARTDRTIEVYRDGGAFGYEVRTYDGKGRAVQQAPLSAEECLTALAGALRKERRKA